MSSKHVISMVVLIDATLIVAGPSAAGAPSEDDVIRQARVHLQRKQFREAVDLLSPAIKPDSAVDMHFLLGLAFQGLKENDRALDAFTRCLRQDMTNDRAIEALRDLLRDGFPRRATTETIEMIRSVIFDGSWTRKEFDVRLALDANEHPARRAFITSGLLYTPVVPRRDPVRASTPSIPLPRSLSFNRICYAFVFDPKENSWRQRFRISFVSESLAGRDFQPLVEEIARAFVHACVIAEDRFGWTTRYASDGVVDIWITDAGPPRAEQSAIAPGHIFFYSSATPRTPAEWLREVFHEYGHLVLPPVDGFVKAEEPFATGLMGEALLLPVLASAGETLPFEASRDDLRTLLEKRLKRPSGLFLQEGPNSSLIQDTTDAGVAYALSFVLHVLERHGPEGVEALFAALPVQAIVRTHDLIRAHEAWLRGKEQTSVRIDAVLQEGGTARTWLYLPWPAIELIVSTDSEVRAATTITLKGATITREGIVIQSGKSIDTQTSLRGLKAGWHLVTFELKAASAPVRLDSVSYRPIQ